MKTYDKRIAFVISDQHLIPHGGIGQFAKGFTEMCQRINWKVDIILDKVPTNSFSEVIKSFGANIIHPSEALSYANHTSTFAFSDSINFEKIINFRNAILRAFETNLYDMIVCNTQEAMSATYALAFSKYIPVVFYTHSPDMIFRDPRNYNDIFLESYNNFYNKHMEFPDITIGTQSQLNVDELTKYGTLNCALLRMPLSERELLEPNTNTNRKGVLYIGRWEERKNPEAFLKVIKETGLPAKVMTNATGAKKFEARFKEAGITDYEIKAGIVGKEKVDFIKSCQVFFMPSLGENYPFAFSECLGHMPCVVLDKQSWSDNFDSKFFQKVSLDKAPETVARVYNEQQTPKALEYIRKLEDDVAQGWIKFINEFNSRRSNNNTAKINKYETVKYRDYITELDRKHIAREDIESVLSNRHKFIKVVYTDDDTYLSKNPQFMPIEEETGLNLFEGL